MSALVAFMTVLMAVEVGVAQDDANTDSPIILLCSNTQAKSPATFSGHLNSTVSQIRRKLSNDGVYYATGQDLGDGDAVYGVGQCRKYLSAEQCLGCFDVAVSEVEPCGTLDGAHVFQDNCYLRYENNDQFFVVPHGSVDFTSSYCGKESTSQPVETFNKAVEELLSNIRVATPRTSDYYTASTITSGINTTIYAIGQCVENISQAICNDCMNSAYNNLTSCLPADEGRAVDVSCFMRYSQFSFFHDNQTINLIPFLDKGSSSKSALIIGVSSSAGFLLLVLAFFLWYLRWKKPIGSEETSALQGGRRYTYGDLKNATNNFSKENAIGKGGFGQVFKAIVDGGDMVAVKRLSGGLRARKEFENEVKLISNVRHRNLNVQLGWSNDGPEPLLVLEYLPHGSLDKFLWGKNKGSLNWKQRYDIIYGIAKGLVHLHEEFHVKIIHRDIKSSNILLDDDLKPKIADFGMARYYCDDRSHVSTHFAGTMGYTAPEYVTHGQLSEKVDVYSFGIVTLEVISGRGCSEVNYTGSQMDYLLNHAWQLYEKGIHNKLADETLDPKEYKEENVKMIVEIGLMCTQSPALIRPTMSDVVLMLSNGPVSCERQMSRPTFIGGDRRFHIDKR